MTKTSKAKALKIPELENIPDPHVLISLELQQAFGLRREEVIKSLERPGAPRDCVFLLRPWYSRRHVLRR